eukprot:TRINITY_DN63404_c0_g1_i1.p1 TRINITY_DN63404_c0_g1~~TRINITY_DN63404_c0_g1_i1.p1  ORF type:complete len:749 (-),score=196.52 TRINITY_DN63404_c0_g1_i1:92-2338(-)
MGELSPALNVAIHLGGALLVILDFLIWVLTLGPVWMVQKYVNTQSQWASPVAKADINGKGQPISDVWRSCSSEGELVTSPFPNEGVKTLWDMLQRAFKRYPNHDAQGSRPLLSWKKDEGFRFPAKVFGTTEWRKYSELESMVKAFGSGLRGLGLSPQPQGDFDKLTGKFKILMYEDTCADWQVCAMGAISQNIVVATAYATLGAEAVVHAVNEGSVTAIVCNRKAVDSLMKAAKDMPSLEAIIYTDFLCTPDERRDKVAAGDAKVKVLSLDEVLEMGKAKPVDPSPPTPESVAVLMYTSGSTGNPKGVIVRHSQLLAMVASCHIQFGTMLEDGGETYIGYLPLAHILELSAEMYFYGAGNRIGYADPKTLLPGPEKCYPTGSLEEFKPTLMAGVPKVWETIKKGAETKLAKSHPAVGFLFKVAMRIKKAAVRTNRYTPLFDLLVFKKFKKMLGGCMKFTLSGGGAISGEVQEWVKVAFGCPLVQGYGLTETCGGTTIQHPNDPSIGIAGSALCSVEITLHSEPEITDANGNPYLCTDTEHSDGSAVCGRGEVWIRGPSITSGYYKLPETTAADFGSDGWFHSGDIGLFTPTGQLKIVDRKKNLVKLKGGEYVACEMINVTYNNADIINTENGGCCVFADHELDRCVLFAQCKEKELKELAAEVGAAAKDGQAMCRDPKVMAAVKAKLDVVAKEAKLPALMHAVAVLPIIEPWTAANGCLTATSKLVSKGVYKKHAEDLKFLKPMGIRG